jgi:glycosyltransferase involved in cell wall biosynthesis
VVAHFRGVDAEVVTLSSPGAEAFDQHEEMAISRVGLERAPRVVRNILLVACAVVRAVHRRPDVVLSVHIVGAPAAVAIRRFLGAPSAQYLHAEEVHARPRLAALAVKNAAAVIAVSRYTAELAKKVGARHESVRVIPSGVDLTRVFDRRPTAHPTVLTVSRLNEAYKGHDVLLHAFRLVRARVPGCEWVVIGEGPLRPQLEGRPGIRLLGAVEHERVPELLAAADVLCQPSLVEPFGQSTLEALAAGRSVVSTRVGGPPEFVPPAAGVLVDPTDEHELVGALRAAAGYPTPNPAARAAAELHDVSAQARRVETLLLRAAGSRAGRDRPA